MSSNDSVGATRAASLRDQLEEYYRQLDSSVRITDFTPISDGWETEVYSFKKVLGARSGSYILRMYPGRDAVEKSTREFMGMAKLAEPSISYPVPHVYDREADTNWLGKPFIVMQKIEGRPLGDVMREDIARQPELLTRFVQLAVNLHRIDYSPFAKWNIASPNALPMLLLQWRTLLENFKQTWAVPVFDWLDAHKVDAAPQISPLHGDFHPNNILLTPENKLYVIDWSSFAIGDYRFDLAWTLLLISTQGYPELRRVILSEYERLSHHAVENIGYFDVIAALRRLFDLSASLGSGAESLGMRPETVEIMRRQRDHYQQVYALLQSITGLTLPEIERLIEGLGTQGQG